MPDHDDNVEVDVKCETFLCHTDYLPPYSTRLNEDGDGEHIQLYIPLYSNQFWNQKKQQIQKQIPKDLEKSFLQKSGC